MLEKALSAIPADDPRESAWREIEAAILHLRSVVDAQDLRTWEERTLDRLEQIVLKAEELAGDELDAAFLDFIERHYRGARS